MTNEIWSILDKVGLKERVELFEKKLDAEVDPAGDNFSVGEKQLFAV